MNSHVFVFVNSSNDREAEAGEGSDDHSNLIIGGLGGDGIDKEKEEDPIKKHQESGEDDPDPKRVFFGSLNSTVADHRKPERNMAIADCKDITKNDCSNGQKDSSVTDSAGFHHSIGDHR